MPTETIDNGGLPDYAVEFGAGPVTADTQRIHLTDDSPGVVGIGGTGDAAATAGSVGSLNAKLRFATSQLAAIETLLTNVAHDAVDAGNPRKIGAQARTSWPAAVADADRANAICDKLGRLLVAGVPRELRGNQQTTITNSIAEITIVSAGAAGIKQDVYGLVIANISATAVNVIIRDSTGGPERFTFAIPAGNTAGFTLPAADGHEQQTAANNWTAQCSASVASVKITAMFVSMLDV